MSNFDVYKLKWESSYRHPTVVAEKTALGKEVKNYYDKIDMEEVIPPERGKLNVDKRNISCWGCD